MLQKIILGSILLVSVILVGCSQQQVPNLEAGYDSTQKQELAVCLSQKGVKMYGTERCPHCQNQKAAFGQSFETVNYVDCDAQAIQCNLAEVQGYPTWVFADGSRLEGEQSLDVLSQQAGCEL